MTERTEVLTGRVARLCARPGCSQPGAATLTFDYNGQAAWLERLALEAHPVTHDLCEAHADRLTVPQGWRLEDRRIIARQLALPADPNFRSQLAS